MYFKVSICKKKKLNPNERPHMFLKCSKLDGLLSITLCILFNIDTKSVALAIKIRALKIAQLKHVSCVNEIQRNFDDTVNTKKLSFCIVPVTIRYSNYFKKDTKLMLFFVAQMRFFFVFRICSHCAMQL